MTDTTSRTTSAQQAPGSSAARAKQEAAGVASTAKDEAAAVAQTAVEEAKQLGSDAGQQAKQVMSDARQQLQTKANEEARRLAGAMDDLSSQLRRMADAGQSGLARDLVAQVAVGTQRVAQHLQQGGLDRTLSDARRLARNRPGTFLLGAAAAGFVAARVARSADTTALKDAATQSGNGHSPSGTSRYGDGVPWSDPDLTLEATQPRPTPQSTGTTETARPASPPASAQRPLTAGDNP